MDITNIMLVLKVVSTIIFLIGIIITMKIYIETFDLTIFFHLILLAVFQILFFVLADYFVERYGITKIKFDSGSISIFAICLQIYLLYTLLTYKR